MEQITQVVALALVDYFNYLSVFGYRKHDSSEKLLIAILIDYLLNSELSMYLSEDNYKTIIRAYYNIAENECLINFPAFSEYQAAIKNTKKLPKFRAAENSMLRVTEDIIYRVV